MPTALVTGGTSGIGAAFARALAARGDDLVLVARDAGRLAGSAADLADRYGVGVEVLAADLAVPGDLDRVAERVASAGQPVETLVSNAGFGVRAPLAAADVSAHEHGIDVMVTAVLRLGGAAAAAMRERGRGTIINVSSSAGFLAMGGYSAIKAWVTTYSEGLANELRRTGVRVTALCPGWVRTEFHARADIGVSDIPGWMWLDADELVAECLADAARGRVISIPSRRYRVLMAAVKLLPRPAVRLVSAKLASRRH